MTRLEFGRLLAQGLIPIHATSATHHPFFTEAQVSNHLRVFPPSTPRRVPCVLLLVRSRHEPAHLAQSVASRFVARAESVLWNRNFNSEEGRLLSEPQTCTQPQTKAHPQLFLTAVGSETIF